MKIKYSLNRLLINCFALAFLMCFVGTVNAQISGGEVKPEKEKRKNEGGKGNKNARSTFNEEELNGSFFYMTGLLQQSYRSFEDQSTFQIYEKEKEETPFLTGGVTVGTLMDLGKGFSLDLGVTYFGHGETYNYEDVDTDSSFQYTNAYMQVGIPLKLRYTYGSIFQFFGFAGITPVNILNIRNKSKYRTVEGIDVENQLNLIKDGFTQVNAMVTGGIGANYFIKKIGFTLGVEYRRHLGNTYSESTFKRDHRMFGYGITGGVILRF